MKRKLITASAIILFSYSIYSCNNQDSSSAPATEETTVETKKEDTASSVKPTDTLVNQPEAPKVEEKKKENDASAVKPDAKVSAKKAEQPKTDAIDQAAIDEGKELIAKSDCLACHRVQDRLVGPAYADVAAKYSYSKSTVQNLASKVISGGTGVWGQIPMAPHPNVTPEAAQKMVTYILSLKK